MADVSGHASKRKPVARIACALLLDTSGSMAGEPIERLNHAFDQFCDEIRADDHTATRAEIAVITFGGEVRVHIPFTKGWQLQPKRLVAQGGTPMGAALNLASDMLAERRRGVDPEHHRSLIFVLTDGAPTDGPVFTEAAARLREAEARRELSVFGFGVGSDADMARLAGLSVQHAPVKLGGLSFGRFFASLLDSLGMTVLDIDRPWWTTEDSVLARITDSPIDPPLASRQDRSSLIDDRRAGAGSTVPPSTIYDAAGNYGGPYAERYLLGRFPEASHPGQVFSLLVSVVSPPRFVYPQSARSVRLKPFKVPARGRRLALIVDAPGLRVLGDHRQTVLVPSSGDSEPVKFDLIADRTGPQRISVTAWDGGSYLGELSVEVTIERDAVARLDRVARSEVRQGRTDGEVTLLVRYDRQQAAYRFEFIDVDYPDEVPSHLIYDPGPAVERLVRRLDALAEGTAGYSCEATRAYLVNEGVQLWQELIPDKLRAQFWERQRRITQLTILTSRDVVPWELLYPKDRRRDAGFLVEQFPVTRAVFGRAQQRRLRLRPARFVVPPGSPADAEAEARALAALLGTRLSTVSELMPLLDLIGAGRFGLLHFACHNRFDPDDGSSIRLDSLFTPTFLATAASDQALARAAPVVFINACRSAGQVPAYNKLDGWAEKFMQAGAAAFIGSLWAVSDETAREFATELYGNLVHGDSLGTAVMSARKAVAAKPGDPTWLAYAVYGDPQARVDLPAQIDPTGRLMNIDGSDQ